MTLYANHICAALITGAIAGRGQNQTGRPDAGNLRVDVIIREATGIHFIFIAVKCTPPCLLKAQCRKNQGNALRGPKKYTRKCGKCAKMRIKKQRSLL